MSFWIVTVSVIDVGDSNHRDSRVVSSGLFSTFIALLGDWFGRLLSSLVPHDASIRPGPSDVDLVHPPLLILHEPMVVVPPMKADSFQLLSININA